MQKTETILAKLKDALTEFAIVDYNRVALAEEFYQSQSVDTPYTSDYSEESEEEDED